MSDEGRLVAGRYRLGQRIGAGAMGVVWTAIDQRLHRTVAIKQLLLQPGLEASEAEEAKQRAMREGRIAARLQHPNAIAVFDVADDDGAPWLIMEYLPSRSLATVVNEQGPLPPREVARIGAQAALALTAAHAAGIVHRDVKPGNILLGEDGTVKITDFGISRAAGDVTVTRTGMLAGTPAYLAPEVAKGYEPGPPSDVFSLGSTLYAVVEGEPPFGLNENTLALLHLVAAGQVKPPQHAGPLTAVLMHLLRPQPGDRPTMAKANEALAAVAAGRPAPLSTPPPSWNSIAPTTHIPGGPSASTQAMAPPTPPPMQVPRGQSSNPAMTRLDARPLSNAPMTRVGPATHPPTRPPQGPPTSPPGANGAAGAEAAAGGSRKKQLWITAIAVAVAAVLGILVTYAFTSTGTGKADPTTQPAQPPPAPSSTTPSKKPPPSKKTTTTTEPTTTTTTPPTTTTTPPTSKPKPSPSDMTSAVQSYYRLLPRNTEEAWKRLGPGMTGRQNYQQYKSFWDTISDVNVISVDAKGDDKVVVKLRYIKGSQPPVASEESRTLTMVADEQSEKILINADR